MSRDGVCAFCDKRGQLTVEDALPKWIGRAVPRDASRSLAFGPSDRCSSASAKNLVTINVALEIRVHTRCLWTARLQRRVDA